MTKLFKIYVGGVYKIKPLKFKKYANCRVLNVLESTVVVEIEQVYDQHDEYLARELEYRTVALFKNIGHEIDIPENAELREIGSQTRQTRSAEKKGMPIAAFNPKTNRIERFGTMREVVEQIGVDKTNVYTSIREKRRLRSGQFTNFQFFDGLLSDTEIRGMITEEIVGHANKKPVYVQFRNGEIRKFDSTDDCMKHFDIRRNRVENMVYNPKRIARGRFRGMFFSREEIK